MVYFAGAVATEILQLENKLEEKVKNYSSYRAVNIYLFFVTILVASRAIECLPEERSHQHTQQSSKGDSRQD